MKIPYLIIFIAITSLGLYSCGNKEDKNKAQEVTVKEEIIKPDTTEEEPEPVVEEVVEEPVVHQERTIIVKKGEWLFDIARKEYGSMHEWHKIYEANKDKINNPDIIYPNQELIIPE